MEKQVIRKMIDVICHEIGGEWLLAGGSLVVAEFGGSRATEDIDLVSVSSVESANVRRNQLFQAALQIGLSPEQVNSAADYYVRLCQGWELDTVLIQRGPKGAVYRPKLSLFLALKLNRGTEIDIQDCRQALAQCGPAEFSMELFSIWSNKRAKELFVALQDEIPFLKSAYQNYLNA